MGATVWLIDKLAEERIQEAQRKGELDNLAGAGRRLRLDDDTQVPEELRAGYRILKNAGFVPPEIALRREIHEVESLLMRLDDGNERHEAMRRLNALLAELGAGSGFSANLWAEQRYFHKVLQKLDSNGER